jgi:hypothetical protein
VVFLKGTWSYHAGVFEGYLELLRGVSEGYLE